LFGSREQIAHRLSKLRADEGDATGEPEQGEKAAGISSLDFELNWSEDADLQATIHALEPPELPDRLTPGQAAQLSEIFEFLHLQSRSLVQSATLPEGATQVTLDLGQWQQLLDLQAQVAEYLRKIGEPEAQ